MNAPPSHPLVDELARLGHAASRNAALDAYGGGWHARLDVTVARTARGSMPVHVEHEGPLRLQKALWPEGPDPVHLMLLHPPGGIAGGDRLALHLDIGIGAHALATTPGAGKWYAADARCQQTIRLVVNEQASLEWLPQETIVHAGADGCTELDVRLAGSASALGIDVTVFGRRASGESFDRGRLRQRLTVMRDDRLLLDDVSEAVGGDAMRGPAALGDAHVSGMLWCASAADLEPELALQAETVMATRAPGLFGASVVEQNLLIARVVGTSPERVRQALVAVWMHVRQSVFGRAPRVPRIWMT